MYCIIVGGGNVGYYLTRDLSEAGHEVLLLEKDRIRAQRLRDEFGDLVLQGDGCEARVMAEVGFQRADIVVAVTGEDEDNLIACQMAKRKFSVPRTIARVNSPANVPLFKKLGIDATVSATNLIFNLIEQEIETDSIMPVGALAKGELEIVTVVLSENSRVVGREVGEVASSLPGEAHIIALVREGSGLLPTPETVLEAGDSVVSLVRAHQNKHLQGIFCDMNDG